MLALCGTLGSMRTVNCTTTLAPDASVGNAHTSGWSGFGVPGSPHVKPVAPLPAFTVAPLHVHERSVVPSGTCDSTTTRFAAASPTLATRIVYVIVSRCFASVLSAEIETARLGAGAGVGEEDGG